jgi:short-subunit dehydrogenase involved in D-alanine esterification of teichoic acids
MRLSGRTALITGGNSGIGLARGAPHGAVLCTGR